MEGEVILGKQFSKRGKIISAECDFVKKKKEDHVRHTHRKKKRCSRVERGGKSVAATKERRTAPVRGCVESA